MKILVSRLSLATFPNSHLPPPRPKAVHQRMGGDYVYAVALSARAFHQYCTYYIGGARVIFFFHTLDSIWEANEVSLPFLSVLGCISQPIQMFCENVYHNQVI